MSTTTSSHKMSKENSFTAQAQHGSNHGLKKDTLGVMDIVFYIIAAASPLTGVIAIAPIMLSMGNGVGSPSAFLVAMAILVLFSVGYLAMSRHVKNAGALYSYVTLGLGRPVGLGAAALTIFAYTAIQVGLYGGFGFYAAELLSSSFGLDVPWWVLASTAAVLCLFLGLHGVHSGAVVLGVLLTLEVILVVVLNGGILLNSPTPASEFSFEPFTPSALFSPGLGIALMFACACFIGFEGSAIYSEEARNPRKTIPRATYISVLFMGALYSLTMWLITNALGVDQAVAISQREGGNLIFWVSNLVLNPWLTNCFNIFIVTAIFAALVTFHNNIARYLYILGRQGLVWSALSYTRSEKQTPYVASLVQTVSVVAIVAPFVVLQLDPYTTLFAWMTGIGSVAIILAQVVAAVAIFVFFRKSNVDKRLWHTLVAPAIATAGLGVFLYYALTSIDVLMGLTGAVANWMVAAIFMIFALGIGYGYYIKMKSPSRYEALTKALTYDN
ncbi:APC family permease [Pseudomonas sp. TCU-HL1]|uniref:APC family permease n=1 Tax=Pseudomonas sp. TCU-HL1 TaxID=1856685 RepID=UPI00085597E0|nr:APC family permease [Pseudomonas sp. TCU-HL1]AOE85903.1 hypothetical protein THL1_3355 [Pseudomonas sp. TCU-HL1]